MKSPVFKITPVPVEKLPPFRVVAIDGDQLVYSIGWASQDEPLNYVLGTVKRALDKIQKNANAERRMLFIRGRRNFREHMPVTHPYKGTRRADKPKWFKEIYDYLRDVQGGVPADGYEADDAVAMMLWRHKQKVILSSPDKDLLGVPGWHYDPRAQEAFYVNNDEAERFFWYQMLAGDSVDNIKGLPALTPGMALQYDVKSGGCGSGKAARIVNAAQSVELPGLVREFYAAWGYSEGLNDEEIARYFEEQADLLYMVREKGVHGSEVHRYA